MAGKLQRRADDGLSYHSWFDNGLSIEGRIIVLEPDSDEHEINIPMSLQFIKSMTLLESISKDPILIILNCPGGEIHSSFAIFDRIKESSCDVCIRGYGAIMSGASIIMQAGDVRQMSPNSYMMIHGGSIGLDMDMEKAKKWMKAYSNMGEVISEIYYEAAKKTNKNVTKSHITQLCKDETILDAQQALELGLIDKIHKG